ARVADVELQRRWLGPVAAGCWPTLRERIGETLRAAPRARRRRGGRHAEPPLLLFHRLRDPREPGPPESEALGSPMADARALGTEPATGVAGAPLRARAADASVRAECLHLREALGGPIANRDAGGGRDRAGQVRRRPMALGMALRLNDRAG